MSAKQSNPSDTFYLKMVHEPKKGLQPLDYKPINSTVTGGD